MHEIVNELKNICALIPFSKERAAYQGSSAVFPVGNYIGKIKFGESEYYEDAYDKLELTVINPEVGVLDKTCLEFGYLLNNTDRMEVSETGIEWKSKVNRDSLTPEEYLVLANVAYNYFSVFA